jgi:putative ABC transport system ATP-binding protein
MGMIEAVDVHKTYDRGGAEVHALRGASLTVEKGEFCSIMGPSGSGKSTLLHVLGGLDHATAGAVHVDGVDLASLSDDELTRFRRQNLGFVFQFFNLLPSMSAWENAALPLMLDGHRLSKLKSRAVALLERVGLADRVNHRPAQLSGGQLQRVALARALMADPSVLLADEPTGNLDSESGRAVLALLRRCAADGLTVVMVTHDANAARVGNRIVELRDGVVSASASRNDANT